MGDRGVVFFQVDKGQLPTKQAAIALRHIASLVSGVPGDGSVASFNFRAGIHEEGGTYWVGLNAQYWGYLFELALARYGVPIRRSSTLPDGRQPVLKTVRPRGDVRRILRPPLTDEEQKTSTVDEALDMLGYAARGVWRRRRGR